MDTGTILIDTDQERASASKPRRVAIYARVSCAENKPNLDSQAERLVAYCTAKGYQVSKVVKEIGSGVNDARPKLLGPAGRSVHRPDGGRTQGPRDALRVPLSRHAAAQPGTSDGSRESGGERAGRFARRLDQHSLQLYCAAVWAAPGKTQDGDTSSAALEAGESEGEMQLVEQHVINRSDQRFAAD